jgi:hypothetical protein
MSERIYNFQDILYLNYYTEEDSEHHLIVDNLAIDMTWEYSRENAPYDLLAPRKCGNLSEAVEFCNRVDNVVYRGYKYNQDSYVTFTTGVTFLNFTQTVQDAIDNKNGWTMKALANLFESLPLSKFTSLIQVYSDGFFLDSTYAVISCLYTLCNGLSVPLVTESGFKLEKFTIS